MSDYPKYQFSVFLNNREEQLVIRADDFEEFVELKKKADTIINKKKADNQTEKHPSAKCETCQADMIYKEGVGAKGPWTALFCPNADSNDRSKHKPIWL